MYPNSLVENGITSVELGVLDLLTGEPARLISAVRNFYAGVLLLLKERLRMEDHSFIADRLVPVVNPDGTTGWTPKNDKTVDVAALQERWKALGWSMDWRAVQHLQRARNEIEHHHPTRSETAVRELVANAFHVVVLALEEIGLRPVDAFSPEAWRYMLNAADAHKAIADRCVASRSELDVPTDMASTLVADQLCCAGCGSDLLSVLSGEYPDATFVCEACGQEHDAWLLIPPALQEFVRWRNYRSVKSGGEWLYGMCPNCHHEAFSTEDGVCLLCDEGLPHDECERCGSSLGLDEQDHDGLCGYCAHMAERVMADD